MSFMIIHVGHQIDSITLMDTFFMMINDMKMFTLAAVRQWKQSGFP